MSQVRPNWPFLAGVASCFAVPVVVQAVDWNPRIVGAALGFAAFTVLGYQFAYRYRDTQTAGRVAVLLIMASLLIGAIGQVDLLGEAPLSNAAYPLTGQRWGCLLFGLFYARILDLGSASPWVRPREASTIGVSRARSTLGDS